MSTDRVREIRLSKRRFYDLQNDLLQSRTHNFQNHLNVFIDFCESDPILKEITEPLKDETLIDFQQWWNNISGTGGSMVGSKRYVLPTDPHVQSSLLYRLLLAIKDEEYSLLQFAIQVYGHKRIDDNIYEFNNDVTRKLVRTLNYSLDELERRAIEERERQLEPQTESSIDNQAVFVVHGRNIEAKDAMFSFLRSLGLRPIEWSQTVRATGKASPYIGEVLDKAFSTAQAVVVLMTPDDEARLYENFRHQNDPPHESNLSGQPRQNVLFEAGLAFGRNQDRTLLIELGILRSFSDILGRHTIRLDNTSEKRNDIALRLETAGCLVDRTGVDWLRIGDFEACV